MFFHPATTDNARPVARIFILTSRLYWDYYDLKRVKHQVLAKTTIRDRALLRDFLYQLSNNEGISLADLSKFFLSLPADFICEPQRFVVVAELEDCECHAYAPSFKIVGSIRFLMNYRQGWGTLVAPWSQIRNSFGSLGLKPITERRLANVDICTIDQLLQCSRQDLLGFRDIGEKTVQEIEASLKARGFSLRPNATLSISELNLDARIEHALERAGLYTVERLITCSRDDLMNIRNVGPKAVDQIELRLAERGYSLAD